jgi:hypothetical protein
MELKKRKCKVAKLAFMRDTIVTVQMQIACLSITNFESRMAVFDCNMQLFPTKSDENQQGKQQSLHLSRDMFGLFFQEF